MPELPEIYLVKQFLDKEYKGKILESFKFTSNSKFSKKSPKFLKEFQQDLNLVLTKIDRKGKLLILEFEKKWWLCIHFGLHGFLRTDTMIVENYDKSSKKIHGIFKFKDDNVLNFVDQLGFGTSFNFFNTKESYEKYLTKYAIDILDKNFTIDIFKQNVEKIQKKNLKRNELCSILLKQDYLCSGIGNYMKCEILYDCKLSPYRSINSIDNDMINNLYKSILKITDINIKAHGRAIGLFKVYLNKDKDEYGNKVIKDKTPDGRTTYWVKEIQK